MTVDPSATRPTLLLRVRDSADSNAWTEFAEIYAPLIHRFARRQGLQEQDAADLTQDVLLLVAKNIGKFDYDPKAGKFRNWLFRIARNRIINKHSEEKRHPQGSGDTDIGNLLSNLPGETDESSAIWDREYEQRMFEWAAEKIRKSVQPTTWQAFWQTAVDGKSAKEVADSLGITPATVYVYKGRVMAQIKEQIRLIGVQ